METTANTPKSNVQGTETVKEKKEEMVLKPTVTLKTFGECIIRMIKLGFIDEKQAEELTEIHRKAVYKYMAGGM